MKTLYLVIIIFIMVISSFGVFYIVNVLISPNIVIQVKGDYVDNGYVCYFEKNLHGMSSAIGFQKGSRVSLQFQNIDKATASSIDFNLDEFNIHTQPLGYLQEQNFCFLADKVGSFPINSTLHPDMKCSIDVFDTASRKSTNVMNPLS